MKKKRCFQRLNKKERQEVKTSIAPAMKKLYQLFALYKATQVSSHQPWLLQGGKPSHAEREVS